MKYSVITIEREYASGGREIGQLVAARLGIPYYGSEVLHMAAQQMGTPPEYMQHYDETAPNSLLYSLVMMARSLAPETGKPSGEDKLHQAELQIIKKLADKGNCVLIGRCAGAILRLRPGVLHVFIHSDPAQRKKRAVESYHVDSAQAEAVIKRYDKKRANYYSFYSDHRWDDKSQYHLVLDSGKLGIDKCVDLIAAAAR